MRSSRHFLLVEDNADGEFLLRRTLLRKYPQCIIHSCHDSDTAAELVSERAVDAVIVHRAADLDGISAVAKIRASAPSVVIIMVSGADRTREALIAGANRFHPYDKWLLLPAVIDEELTAEQ